MKQKIEYLLHHTVSALKLQGIIDPDCLIQINLERARDTQHGDFATNLAMLLAKPAKLNPRQMAEKIVALIPEDNYLTKIEIAGPGFINFFINPEYQFQIVKQIHLSGNSFGKSTIGNGKKVQVEFVSANPTGPLHVGHGRGAAYGSAVADLMEAVGYSVEREYYVNDAGRQMDILASSVWLRYLEKCGEILPAFPSNGYRGEYIRNIADDLYQIHTNDFRFTADAVFQDLTADEPQGGDKEKYIDAVIERSKLLLGSIKYKQVFKAALDDILQDIKDDLAEFGVTYENWFFEQQLMDDGSVADALKRLDEAGYIYVKDGATWFASSRLGDEKDRVVIRDNGQTTYFASDIAYHMQKLNRGYDLIINIWGADHHGYIPRVKAAIQALGANEDKLKVLLVQFAVLYRGDEKVQMSTRSGEFVTLRALRDEVGKDPCRFFYVMRKSEQHMDFDLKLATSKSNENPVYYVQYAYARICSVFRQMPEKQITHNIEVGMQNLNLLTADQETVLLTSLAKYPEILERAAIQYEPHQLIQYLRDLANQFHSYYNAHQFLVDNIELCNARLNLICAIKQVLSNALTLLKINTPETM